MEDLLLELIVNYTLWTAVLSFAVAQLIKIVLELKRTKKINLSLVFSSGGMPSSHSSFVSALTTSIGLKDGFDSSIFALGAVISMVVMYDAAGVRRAAGNQAAVINKILENVENQGLIVDKKLKELLGHTPVEVAAGALLGVIISIICVGL